MSYADTDPRFVYQCLDAAGEHLYVGCTVSQRFGWHRKNAPWFGQMARVVITVHPDRASGEASESQLIREIQPPFNVINTARQAVLPKRGKVTATPSPVPDVAQLTTAETANALGVSPRTVHRMIVAGELTPVIKLSGMRGAYILDAEQVRTIQRNRAA